MIAFLIALVLGDSAVFHECRGADSAPSLSHVVMAAHDLEAVSAEFRQLGFQLKEGRLHPNNVLNRHIKFRDGTGIELMAVVGNPADAMARRYARLAAERVGGVYVALDVLSTELPDSVAAALGLEAQRSASGSWQFVSFPDSSQAAAMFFAAGVPTVLDPDSLVSHVPDVSGLAEAWLEGGAELISLLERMGAKRCGPASGPDGQVGERLGLRRGQVVIVPARSHSRPRVLGVVLQLRSPGSAVAWPHQSFWIRYRYDTELHQAGHSAVVAASLQAQVSPADEPSTDMAIRRVHECRYHAPAASAAAMVAAGENAPWYCPETAAAEALVAMNSG